MMKITTAKTPYVWNLGTLLNVKVTSSLGIKAKIAVKTVMTVSQPFMSIAYGFDIPPLIELNTLLSI